jgi:hypothetical protein
MKGMLAAALTGGGFGLFRRPAVEAVFCSFGRAGRDPCNPEAGVEVLAVISGEESSGSV